MDETEYTMEDFDAYMQVYHDFINQTIKVAMAKLVPDEIRLNLTWRLMELEQHNSNLLAGWSNRLS